jgi:enamine deaminase RidA (YjgF/YER057c/UK114 family)
MTTGEPTMTSGRVELLSPDGLVRSPAFSHVAVVSGAVRTIYVGGQDAVTATGEVVGKGDLAAQTTQILMNIETALAAVGAGIEHVIKWNLLVVDGQPIEAGFAAFQRFWGSRSAAPPLITAAFVNALGRPDWLAEMDAIAVVPA